MNDTRTVLVTITGKDRPGVTSTLFDALGEFNVEVIDVEQIVIRGQLVLCILVTAGRDEGELRAAVHRAAARVGMHAEIRSGVGDNAPRAAGRSHVTLIGAPLRSGAMGAITGRITACGANIDRIFRLSKYPVTSIELHVSGAPTEKLRAELAAEAKLQGVDVAVQRSGLWRRAKRLIVMDVDSTLIQDEVIELLAERAGCLGEVAKVTEAAMRGELDFEQSLRERVALLAGLDASVIEDVRRAVRLAPGARTLIRTLKRLDYRCGIVSGGFTQVTDHLVAELGIDYSAANTLEIVDGRLTGRLVGPIIDRPGKAAALRRFAAEAGVPLSQTVAVGDGANDLDMLNAAGLGVAFNAKPVVREVADAVVNVPYLDTILFLLGLTRDEIEAADAEDDAEDSD
ncbi:phosphoserine phosphatase SerB [Carbonactinospora thermoautotrophica]|nr:phosphoserine phosphatase SerB [Carbonactinospora thermoautotrophica]MCX9190680.1 phosphoserine phosphatase SerB [Carbonactinospora thermoautotrophica]